MLDSTPRGIMYDAFGSDSNNVPREGVAISSHWMIPNANPWGLVKGQRFGTAKAPYFRTIVHETGHALGLFHNTVDNGFMNTTDVIASSPGTFPNNIKWEFASDDQKRLRHYPDVFIRPGGTAFGTASMTTPPISPTDLSQPGGGFELKVTPLLVSVPIGAPVRVDIELTNVSDVAMEGPATLSMAAGLVQGAVTDPAGTARTFLPLVRCLEETPLKALQPGESVKHSITLLRGREGALFPTSGAYTIEVEAHWDAGEGVEVSVKGTGQVMVTGAKDEAHAEAALKVLASPDALLTLVFGGDHLTDGVQAIQAAVANKTLRPHFAYVEAKRVGRQFGKRKANLKEAAELMDGDCVMSAAEVKSAAGLVQAAKDDKSPAVKTIVKTLKSKARALNASDAVKAAVDAL